MIVELCNPDPSGTYRRKAVAARRLGKNQRCACGEDRPQALIKKDNKTICAKCQREKDGMTPIDKHHVAGKANSDVIIPAPVNDHRADLNECQYRWPAQTLQNPHGCPVLAAAAKIRGFCDTAVYLINKLLDGAAQMLEALHGLLVQRFGERWWIGTPLEQFAPKQ